MKPNKLLFSAVLLAMLTLLYLGPAQASSPQIYTSNYPLQYFTERIAGDDFKVILPVPGDTDPAYWNPTTEEIGKLQRADLVVLNGAGYEKWAKKISLPRSKVVISAKPFKARFIYNEELVTHSHGGSKEHAHENLAFTTWLDLDLAAEQARVIATALERKWPQHKERFTRNLAALQQDLRSLDRELRALSAKQPGKAFVGSHPVYEYLASRYQLNIKAVHWEPEQVPDATMLRELQTMNGEHGAEWMIWEGQPDGRSVAKLNQIGMRSLVFEPCANRPDRGDFLSLMEQNLRNLELAY